MLGILAYAIAVLAPAIAATSGARLANNGWVHHCACMSGVVAYTMISLQFVLAARISWIVKPFGFPSVLRFHKSMAGVATLLVLIHIVLLVLSRGNWSLVLNPWASWPIQVGRVAVLLLLMILAISYWRRLIPINYADWRWFHNALAWSILILGFVHSVAIGSSFRNTSFSLIWTIYFSSAVMAWGWKRYSSMRGNAPTDSNST